MLLKYPNKDKIMFSGMLDIISMIQVQYGSLADYSMPSSHCVSRWLLYDLTGDTISLVIYLSLVSSCVPLYWQIIPGILVY